MSIFGLYNFGRQHKKMSGSHIRLHIYCSTITLVKLSFWIIYSVYLNFNVFKSDCSTLFLYACVGFLSTAASRVFAVAEQCPSAPTRGQSGPVGVTACTRTGTLTYKYAHTLRLSLVVGSIRFRSCGPSIRMKFLSLVMDKVCKDARCSSVTHIGLLNSIYIFTALYMS